ncbi:MAG TPA: MerC family mercury resistance protein [Candidatus Acidoferrales bacterium]|nr:MerC family mercury resistance protein [Candidatus Acidoferrales bacterium]
MNRRWKPGLAALPGIGVSMLPKLACPACWPAYAALLGSLGLGFLISATYLFPLTVAFLILAVGALFFGARERHGYRPFVGGIVAAAGILAGKFVLESNRVMYGAVGLLVLASLWNAWPHRASRIATACSRGNSEGSQRTI